MNDCTRIDQELVDYLEGELAGEERVALESHVTSCPRCSDTLRSYRAIQDAYRAVPETDVSAHVAESILGAARQRPVARRRVRRALLVAAGLVLCASIAALAIRLRARHDPVEELVQRAEAQRAAGHLERAASLYEDALALAGDDDRAAELLYTVAALRVEQGLFENALAALSTGLERQPALRGRRDVLLLFAEALAGAGRRDEAIEAYRRLARRFPEDQLDIEQRVHALEKARSDEEALMGLGYAGE